MNDIVFDAVNADQGRDWIWPERMKRTARINRGKFLPSNFQHRDIPVRNSSGSSIADAGYVVLTAGESRARGLHRMSIYERLQAQSITSACQALLKSGDIHAFYKLDVDRVKDMKELLTVRPLWLTMHAHRDLLTVGITGELNSDYLQSEYLGGHSVACTGWTYKDSELFWIMQNSWSERWGARGFFFVPDLLLKKIILGGAYYVVTDPVEAQEVREIIARQSQQNESEQNNFISRLYRTLLACLRPERE